MSGSGDKRLYLENVHLVDYKSIEDLNVDFKKDLNIIIGKNGAGKSNLLEAINHALIFRIIPVKYPFKVFVANFNTSAEESVRFEITKVKRAELSTDDYKYDGLISYQKLFINDTLVFENSPDRNKHGNLFPSISSAFKQIKLRYGYPVYIRYSIPEEIECITTAGRITIPIAELDMIEVPFDTPVVDSCFYQFEKMVLNAEIEPTAINKEFLLDHILPEEKLISNLKKFSPIQGFKLNENINIYNDGKRIIIENLKFDFLIDGKWMPWSYLSDGTKRLFYLIAEVTRANGGLILIEEPELGVHPHQFNLLMHFLKEQSQYSQIIMSTHAPTALDHLNQDELDHVLIAYTTKEKGTQTRRMEPSQKEKAIEYMTKVGALSDYWLMSDLEE